MRFDFTGVTWARAVGNLFNDNDKANDTLIRVFNVASESDVKPFKKSKVAIYPNPTTGQLVITFNENAKQQLSIWNTAGQKVYETTYKSDYNILKLDLKEQMGLTKGIYFIRLQNSTDNQLFKLVLY